MNFKFKLGETVKLKNSEKTGQVKGRKFEEYEHKTGTSMMVRYYVNLGSHFNEWYDTDRLEPLFSDKFEAGLIDELINGNLVTGNFEEVKRLHKEKQRYSK